jgi:hypothetical protein
MRAVDEVARWKGEDRDKVKVGRRSSLLLRDFIVFNLSGSVKSRQCMVGNARATARRAFGLQRSPSSYMQQPMRPSSSVIAAPVQVRGYSGRRCGRRGCLGAEQWSRQER